MQTKNYNHRAPKDSNQRLGVKKKKLKVTRSKCKLRMQEYLFVVAQIS